MYLKFAVVTLSVLALAWLGRSTYGPPKNLHATAAGTIELVPATLGGSAPLRHWKNPQPGGGAVIETGALFAAGAFGPSPVILDFFRGSSAPHNGIACFLIEGESLESENLMRLKTASGPARFDVGVTRLPDQVRLIAATECSAAGCTATRLPFLSRIWADWDWRSVFQMHRAGVVPAAIILTARTDPAHAAVSIAGLRNELKRVTGDVSLAPAMQLAAVQAE